MRNQWVMTVWMAAATLGAATAATLGPGIDAGVTYTQDYFRDVSGGLKRGGGGPGTVDLSATVDGRAWGGSQADVFYVDFLGTLGGSISNQVGDLQGMDNIEAYNTAKVFEAWYQHSFGDSGVDLRLGLQDYNALFNALDVAGLFINSSFGLDPTIAQADVSTFPVTSLGAVVRWQASDGLYVMGGVYDGVPGLPGHPAGTHIELRDGDGVFSALETGVAGGGAQPYKIAVGGWYRTSDYEGPDGQPRDRNHGVYVIGEKRLIGSDQQLPAVDAFFQFGTAENDRNTLNRYIGAGVDVTGLIPARADDVVGLGMARAHTGDTYRHATPGTSEAETVVELTYLAPISDHFSVQPDMQYIIDPGADTGIDNALAVGVRAQLNW